MADRSLKRLALAAALFLFTGAAFAQQRDEPTSPRLRTPVTFLQINDVYSTVPVDGLGGLARVATVKQRMAAEGRTPFLVMAGDFLSPSVASATFQGAQMIAALNAAGLDLATLGNHEFDFGDDVLLQRMREAKWQWVVANVIDTNTGQPIGGAAPYVMRTFNGLKVAFLGLCLNTGEITGDKLTHTKLLDPIETAAQFMPQIKRENPAVIVAVTHLTFADDRRLVERFPEIDLTIGGHEHFLITATENRSFISKAGSDARYVARIDVNQRSNGTIERFFELLAMTKDIADEPRTAEVVASYENRLSAELDTLVGATRVPLDADSIRLRSEETNIGDFVADAIREAAGTDIVIMNSGSIRGDRVFAAGPLTRRTILAMHPFGNLICKLEMTGRVVLDALNSGVAKMPETAGQFPQVSGLRMTVDPKAPVGSRVTHVTVNGQPLDPNRTYTVATPDFVFKGGDNYTMFAGQRVLVGPEAGDLLVAALEKYVAARREIAPQIDGRITILR